MHHILSKLLYKTKQASQKLFYTKSQKFEVDFKVKLTNKSDRTEETTVIMPVVQSIGRQEILFERKFSQEIDIQTEETYGNKYITWKCKIGANGSQSLSQQFNIEVLPQKVSLTDDYDIGDYRVIDLKQYLTANKYIQPHNSKIKEIAKELTTGNTDVISIVKLINDHVIKNLTYGKPIKGLYSCDQALENDQVDCGGFDTFFVSLCIACNIPARVISGFLAGYDNNSMHAWVEFMLPDKTWVPADPSMEQLRQKGQTRKSGELGFIGSDRITLSTGCDIPIQVNGTEEKIDILQNPFILPENTSIETDISFATKNV